MWQIIHNCFFLFSLENKGFFFLGVENYDIKATKMGREP